MLTRSPLSRLCDCTTDIAADDDLGPPCLVQFLLSGSCYHHDPLLSTNRKPPRVVSCGSRSAPKRSQGGSNGLQAWATYWHLAERHCLSSMRLSMQWLNMKNNTMPERTCRGEDKQGQSATWIVLASPSPSTPFFPPTPGTRHNPRLLPVLDLYR
jgi:hypothetical protein